MSDAWQAPDLAGRVVWVPRADSGVLRNERPDLAARVAAGRAAMALPGLLAALLSMCGQAHLLASRLAVDAASGRARALDADERRMLQLDTLREHLRRLWLDWPRLWPDAEPAPVPFAVLSACPVLKGIGSAMAEPTLSTDALLAATRLWLNQNVFGMDPEAWLAHWVDEDEIWLARWCAATATWPARLLHAVRPTAGALSHPMHAWWASDDAINRLAAALRHDPEVSRRPGWSVDGVETGPWARAHDRARLDALGGAPTSAWWRMAARLADLARLALPCSDDRVGGADTLQHGIWCGPDHTGLAWVEMARGTLLHWVRLDSADAHARVQACQVISPTEWNFHPQGPVARLLASLPHDPRFAARATLAVAAWDPCVPFAIDACDHPQEHLNA